MEGGDGLHSWHKRSRAPVQELEPAGARIPDFLLYHSVALSIRGLHSLAAACTTIQCLGVSSSSESSSVAEPKEGRQVPCDTAHNLRLACPYITRGGRSIPPAAAAC